MNSSFAFQFSPALSGAAARELRERLDVRRDDSRGGPAGVRTIRVQTIFEMAEAPWTDDTARHEESLFLIFDIHRLILYRSSPRVGDPDIRSLIRYLLDNYPFQPFRHFADAERGSTYKFAFDLATLDIVPSCVEDLDPGEYSVLDFATGELLRGVVYQHPLAAPRPKLVQLQEPAPISPLAEITTDRNMRAGAPPDLDDVLGEAAGIIRSDDLGTNAGCLAAAMTLVTWNHGAKREFCYGTSAKPSDARRVARCEAVERFQIAMQPPSTELVRGSYLELADYCIDPEDLFFGRSPECPGDIGAVFDGSQVLSWTWAWGVAERKWRLVPAQEIWYNTPELMGEPRFVYATTSGCAAGLSLVEAATFAALEAVERDAFLVSWYLGRPAAEIDLDSLKSLQAQDLIARLRLALPNYRVVLLNLTLDVGMPVVGGLLIRESGRGRRVFCSAAADIDADKACFRAIKDLTGLTPAIGPELRERVLAREVVPMDPYAHAEHFAVDAHFREFEYLELGRQRPIPVQEIGRESPVASDETLRLDHVLESLARRLRRVGAGLYIKDLTHPLFQDRGAHVARAVTPGLYPLWFGGRARRFAVTNRLRRLAQTLTGRPLDRSRLRLGPHPLA